MKRPTSIFILFLAILLFYFVTSPQWEEAKTLQASMGEYKNVVDNAAQISTIRDQLLSSYNAIPKDALDRISKVLPDNADTVQLALNLDAIASRYGIAIKNIRVESAASPSNGAFVELPATAKPYEKVTINFSFISSYDNFMRFMSDLERSLRIMDIQSVGFRTADTGFYEHEVSVDTYWLK